MQKCAMDMALFLNIQSSTRGLLLALDDRAQDSLYGHDYKLYPLA